MICFIKFVNSNTVRNHLHQIRYQPTALEAAWLVWQCKTISLEEKYTAWQEIIETLPDCPANRRASWLKSAYRDSTHTFLQAYVAQQKELTAEFYHTGESAVYHAEYQILPKGERFWRERRSIEKYFSSLESALQAVPKNEGDIIHITIYKKNSKGNFHMAARFLPDFRLAFVDVRPGSICAQNMSKDEWDLYAGVLGFIESHFIQKSFPTPFHSGDFLYNPNMPEGTLFGGIFIAAETKSHRCDSGLFMYNNKPDTIWPFYPRLMDCEYYPVDALPESYRIFPLISRFLKDNNAALEPWNFAELINDYHDILIPTKKSFEGFMDLTECGPK